MRLWRRQKDLIMISMTLIFIYFIMRHPDFKIKYYKVRDEYKDNFKYERGNIFNIDKLGPKKAGAIFFRNAMYIPTNNYGIDEFDGLISEKSVKV